QLRQRGIDQAKVGLIARMDTARAAIGIDNELMAGGVTRQERTDGCGWFQRLAGTIYSVFGFLGLLRRTGTGRVQEQNQAKSSERENVLHAGFPRANYR
ncbi:MAG: hypothetical protein MK538_20035, partial [Planctomycetes bacterium]|nr:hypothetical protein [Planctomycetota bacterium]